MTNEFSSFCCYLIAYFACTFVRIINCKKISYYLPSISIVLPTKKCLNYLLNILPWQNQWVKLYFLYTCLCALIYPLWETKKFCIFRWAYFLLINIYIYLWLRTWFNNFHFIFFFLMSTTKWWPCQNLSNFEALVLNTVFLWVL